MAPFFCGVDFLIFSDSVSSRPLWPRCQIFLRILVAVSHPNRLNFFQNSGQGSRNPRHVKIRR